MADKNGNGLKWVGTRQVRPDGVDKVTGRASFGAADQCLDTHPVGWRCAGGEQTLL